MPGDRAHASISRQKRLHSISKKTILFRMNVLKLILLLLLSIPVVAQDVYKTPSGQKYHLATCRMVKNVSERISTTKAHQLGLQPCKICNPPAIGALNLLSPNKQSGQGETVQCKGTTKAGSQCKHMTRIANGYCFQHDPDKN